jgi:hypothetical protein
MALQVTEVQKALKGADYPAKGKQLAELAKRNGAQKDLVEKLQGMGQQSFSGPDKVMHELKGSLGGSS